jgi:CRP/FNR family cyclic AMP-dependent transcriptional regulator
VVDPEWLKQVDFFAGLGPAERALLAQSLQRRNYERGDYLFHQGDPGTHLHLIGRGAVRVFTVSLEGQENTITTLKVGDALGEMALLDGLPRSASAQALGQTITYVLHRDVFQDHLRAMPDMAISILTYLSRSLRFTTAYAENRTAMETPARLATVLLDLAERHGRTVPEGTIIDLTLTQRELANMVGVSREWVNKVIGQYRRAGFLTLKERKILLTDLTGLAEAARSRSEASDH